MPGAKLTICILIDKLACIFVNFYFRGICQVRVICLYDPYCQPAIPHVLYDFKGFPVTHIASAAAAGLCYKLMFTVGAYGFSALFYAGQCDFMPTGGAYAVYILISAVIVIKEVGRHNGFYPAF